jgi:hypothetical protein
VAPEASPVIGGGREDPAMEMAMQDQKDWLQEYAWYEKDSYLYP